MIPAGLERYGWPPPPRVNWHLVGHAEAERTLLDAFASGKLHHAWLLTGPRGIGKATLAFRFARFLLARGTSTGGLFAPEPPQTLFVEPDSPLFRRSASGGHADLLTIERGLDEKRGKLRSEIVVTDVRDIAGVMGHTPAEGGWRVVIVDAADDMNRHAANALLKILEEPPDRAVLLLVSHAPGLLLPTIRSRCRVLALRPLAEETIAALIGHYRPTTSAQEARELACLAAGSVGRALTLAEQGGLALHQGLLALFASLPRLDGVALHRMADSVVKAGADETFETVCTLFREVLSRLIRFAAVAGSAPAAAAAATAEERAMFVRLAPAASLDRWLEVWENTTRLLARVDGANLDRKQVVLNIFLDLERAVRPPS
ncbi:MAG: DNA polymerase III subunit delta' [Rhodospirillales bacterium]